MYLACAAGGSSERPHITHFIKLLSQQTAIFIFT
jgi:hypothetical protein